MSLVDTDAAEWLDVQFNPERLQTKLEAVFNDLVTLGAAGEEPQFKNSKGFTIDFELRFDALVSREWNAQKIEKAKNFLWSCATPREGDGVGTIDPPKILFVWPRLYTVVGRISSPSCEEQRFARTGECTLMVAKIQIREVLSARRTSERVRQAGIVGGSS